MVQESDLVREMPTLRAQLHRGEVGLRQDRIPSLPFLKPTPCSTPPAPALKVFLLEKPLQRYRGIALQVAILIPAPWN